MRIGSNCLRLVAKMCSVKILSVLLLVNAVYAENMQHIIQDVISHTNGVPDKGIIELDPVVLEHLHVPDESMGSLSHFTNMKVTGFRSVKMSDYVEEGNKVKYTLKLDFVAEGPVRLEILKRQKSLNGAVKYEGGATGIISYPYTTKKVNGKDIYEIGSVEIKTESQHAKSTINDEMKQAIANDPEMKAQQPRYEKEVRSVHEARVVSEIARAVMEKYIENLKIVGQLGGL